MLQEEELTGKVIQCFYKVYNELGYGFLESVYQNALGIELVNAGLRAEPRERVAVHYLGRPVGFFEADLTVERKVILELKAQESLQPVHEAQLLNYLRATNIEVGLLLNFGKTPEFRRKFFSNGRKTSNAESVRPGLGILLQPDPL